MFSFLVTPFIFFLFLVEFHSTEYLLVYIYNRKDLSFQSTLITAELTFWIVLGYIEYFFYGYFNPTLKTSNFFQIIGILLLLIGEGMRKVGMITAQHNFTHEVQYQKRQKHRLIDFGIYAYIRHPGYLGFWIWCIGGQLFLGNVISAIAYAAILWKWFAERIEDEEEALSRFFPTAYKEYKKRVRSWFPFLD
ncbi:protein-s-isoprenylcysteine o-methyltransferase [Anaeramoeba flamelloides]|uniref:Protein-S-isoprenylcysteine O-methyltransferase n=1 Tax=Anaeramoeba flamelloides TaxID=1746091 RepID=A0AAV7YWY2_9EUKA|nr:protein-s-isoprenylcysteine o-methyltransferase [Anaeramoeba flamelloides]